MSERDSRFGHTGYDRDRTREMLAQINAKDAHVSAVYRGRRNSPSGQDCAGVGSPFPGSSEKLI